MKMTPQCDLNALRRCRVREDFVTYVKIDLGYRVAYLVDDQGVTQLATSGVTRSSVDDVLACWGYARTRDGAWETTDILNAIDAVRFPVEPTVRVEGAN